MPTRARRASVNISLVLISAAAVASLGGCAQEEMRRDVYASKEDCLADWGNSPSDCEPAPRSAGVHPTTGGGYYYGRPYPSPTSITKPRSNRSIGTSSVSRGGFGASGRSAAG